MKYYIENASKMMMRVYEEEKESYFKNRLDHQLKIIEERMKEGYRSVRWVFEPNYYNSRNELHNSWRLEFEQTAKKLFTEAGYTINGSMIYW